MSRNDVYLDELMKYFSCDLLSLFYHCLVIKTD